MRVLLIEDSRRLQAALASGLRKAGFSVDVAGDGERGLYLLGINEYDVAILDLMLPGIDGLTVLQQIRQQGKDIHVLILTARHTLEDRVKGLQAGGDDYLVKPFAFDELPRRTGPIDAPLFWDMTLPDGREGRAIGVSFFPYIDREDHPEIKTPRGVQVVLARDRSEMPSILGALVIGLFSVLLLTASGILVVVPPLVLAGLRPLKQLADRTASIDLKYPGFRYPGDNLPDELRPIVDRLNGLLQRIEDAFSREKRLSADMAHELKTPVAELRSLAEVALRWPEDSAFVHDALRNTIEIAQEMDRRISVLLALSRNESGEQHVSLSDVDLSGLIRDLWIPWEKMAKEKRIRTKLDIPSIAVVTTDSGMLSSILTNLFSNAVEYCPEGGRFTCSMEQGPEKVRLTMINSNNTLTEEDLPKIFDYLWRKDPARTDGSHIGLGLVLVESFARILDIPIKAELLQDGDFSMTLEIPVLSSGEGTTKEES